MSVRQRLTEASVRVANRYHRASWPERVFAVVLVVIVSAGIWYRCAGVIIGKPLVFWVDECLWGTTIMEQPLKDQLIRPIGFMALNKALALMFGPSETVLRAVSVLAGIGTMLVAPLLARRLFKTWLASLLFVLVLALNPEAIDHAREFKPYAVGLFLHAWLALLALRYTQTKRQEALVLAVFAAAPSVLFAQDVIFAYPGFFLALGLAAWQSGKRKHFGLVVAGAAVTLLLVGAQYAFIWSKITQTDNDYWGRRYHVFYMPQTDKQSHLAWFFSKYQGMVGVPGIRRLSWVSEKFDADQLLKIRGWDELLWVGLHFAGIGVLAWRRAYGPALLLLGPFVTLGVINTLGHWPLGTFRANLFMLVYSAAIAAFLADVQAKGVLRWFARTPAVLMSAAVLAPFALLGGERDRRPVVPTYSVPMPEVLRRLTELASERPSEKKETLVLHRLQCDAWVYYTKHHPTTSRAYGRQLEHRFSPVCTDNDGEIERAIRTVAERGDRVWFLGVTWKPERVTRFLKRAFVIDVTEDIEASRTIIATHK